MRQIWKKTTVKSSFTSRSCNLNSVLINGSSRISLKHLNKLVQWRRLRRNKKTTCFNKSFLNCLKMRGMQCVVKLSHFSVCLPFSVRRQTPVWCVPAGMSCSFWVLLSALMWWTSQLSSLLSSTTFKAASRMVWNKTVSHYCLCTDSLLQRNYLHL